MRCSSPRPRGREADQRAVAVAFLNALRALSASGPVLVAIDDVQWLDRASADVLGYAARRLRKEPIGLLLTQRSAKAARPPLGLDRAAMSDRVTSLAVGPLTLGAIRALLRRQLGLVLPRPALLRIHQSAGGNPFYALELARVVDRERFRAGSGEPLPLPGSLRELVRGRIAALPTQTRQALLVAAALSEPRLDVVATAVPGRGLSALRAAIEAEVIAREGDRIRFTHPLLAAATYEMAANGERRDVHRRLAMLVGEVEQHARHLALAVDGPDPAVAAALQRASAHARARGASAAAAELAEQAWRLTPPGHSNDLARRATAAAASSFLAGDTARARTLLEGAIPGMTAGPLRAEALVLLGRLHRFEGDQPRAAELLREALSQPGADERVRADAAQGLAWTLFYMREELAVALRGAGLAAELAARVGSPALLTEALVLKCDIEGVLGRPEADRTLRAAEELSDDARASRVADTARWGRGYFLLWTDEVAQAASILRVCHEDLALAGERAMAVARIHALWALGLLELSLERPANTVRLLAPERERLLAVGVGEPGSIRFVPDEIEALVSLGRLNEAERLLGWLEERGRALDRAFALAASWRCRGMLMAARGEARGALAAFERALVEHERVAMPFERGPVRCSRSDRRSGGRSASAPPARRSTTRTRRSSAWKQRSGPSARVVSSNASAAARPRAAS